MATTIGNDVDLVDDGKLLIGDGDDLQIYHDATDSIIVSDIAGDLRIKADNLKLERGGNTELFIDCSANGAVDLYYDNGIKLATTSTGIDVTGNVVVSGTVDGVDIATRDAILTSTTTTAGAALPKAGGTMTGNLSITKASASTILTSTGSGNDASILFATPSNSRGMYLDDSDSNKLKFYTGYGKGVAGKEVTFDNEGKLGIGTTSPARTLHVNSLDANIASFEGHQGEGLVISSGVNGQVDIIGYDDGASSYNPIAIRASSGVGIYLSTTGTVTMPSQPAFLGIMTTNSGNLTVSAWTTITVGAEAFDQNSDFNLHTFTAPVTGKYMFTTKVRLEDADTTANYYHVGINTSNRNYYTTHSEIKDMDSDPDYTTWGFSVLADMDANDTANLRVYQNGGAAQTKVEASTHWSGHLVC